MEKPYRPSAEEDPCLQYGMAFSIGDMNYMLIKWVEDEMTMGPQLIVDYLHYGLQSEGI